MTYSKTLVILAKSKKHSGFCIAGKEIDTNNWVRPVKNMPFTNYECCNLSNLRRSINVFDVVEMTFIEESPRRYQPENEKIDMSVRWNLVDSFQIRNLESLIDEYDLLNFINANSFHKSRLNSLNLQNSLQLIRLSENNNVEIIYLKYYSRDFYRPRLHFIYNERSYNLPITDPYIPILDNRIESRTLRNPYIVIGIGEEFKNNHYIFVVMISEI